VCASAFPSFLSSACCFIFNPVSVLSAFDCKSDQEEEDMLADADVFVRLMVLSLAIFVVVTQFFLFFLMILSL
jgi:hypothetical protein